MNARVVDTVLGAVSVLHDLSLGSPYDGELDAAMYRQKLKLGLSRPLVGAPHLGTLDSARIMTLVPGLQEDLGSS